MIWPRIVNGVAYQLIVLMCMQLSVSQLCVQYSNTPFLFDGLVETGKNYDLIAE